MSVRDKAVCAAADKEWQFREKTGTHPDRIGITPEKRGINMKGQIYPYTRGVKIYYAGRPCLARNKY